LGDTVIASIVSEEAYWLAESLTLKIRQLATGGACWVRFRAGIHQLAIILFVFAATQRRTKI